MEQIKPFQKITSVKNPRIKNLLYLQKRKHREEQGKFGVEGAREIKRALDCSYSLVECYLCPPLFSEEAKNLVDEFIKNSNLSCFEIDEKCFEKIAIREKTDGIYTVFSSKHKNLEDCIPLKGHPLILVLEGIEKPGNLGALLRSADGAGASGVITLNDCCDPFNPQVIRSSLGTIFSTPLIQTNILDLQDFLRNYNFESFAASLSKKSKNYTEMCYTKSCAFFLGNEAHGLSQNTVEICDQEIAIPMLGIADSLNVSVAGATLLYEALRQRS
ncbi:MAG: TrmH family RNA methyltransferase [Oligoflexales bacterium]